MLSRFLRPVSWPSRSKDMSLNSATAPEHEHELRRILLARAGALRPEPAAGAGAHAVSPSLAVVGYCALAREQIREMRLENPVLALVLSGVRELWRGDLCERIPAGVPFVMAAGASYDVVNVPDERSGRYESLCVFIDAELRAAARGMVGPRPPSARLCGSRLDLTSDLVEAFGRAARALSDPREATVLGRHRILEILLMLRGMPAAQPLFAATLSERAEAVLQGDLGRAWRVGELARELGVGASTLRRRLAQEGTAFRHLLRSARMAAAGDLLASPGWSVAQAAQAVGYRSRSHFARRFRAAHSITPGRTRRHAPATRDPVGT